MAGRSFTTMGRKRTGSPMASESSGTSTTRPSVTADSVTTEEAHEDGGGVSAQRVREAALRALHLSRPGLAAQLGDDLADLRGAGGADGVALGLQATRRVHGNLAAEARPALLGGEPARARLEEAEPFGGDDL